MVQPKPLAQTDNIRTQKAIQAAKLALLGIIAEVALKQHVPPENILILVLAAARILAIAQIVQTLAKQKINAINAIPVII